MSKTNEYRQKLADMFANILLEDGLEWKKGWQGVVTDPRNGHSGHVYKGINRFLLSMAAVSRGYQDPRWCTFKQIQNHGWKLHDAKGQGVNVEYWFPYDREDKKTLTWQEWDMLRRQGERFGERYMLRSVYKTVFNADLIEGIPEIPEPEKREIHADKLVDKISGNMGVSIVNDGGDRAFYRVNDDTIHLPLPEHFYTDYGYASTALHELGHATGASHRLARNMTGTFGGDKYAYEELVAEISSCFMSADLSMEQEESQIENHKAYVQNWVKEIRENPDALIHAIQDAEKAAAYMEYQAELITKAEYETIAGASLNTKEDQIMSEEKPQEVTEVPAREIARFEPRNVIYHLDHSDYLSLKINPESCEYVFYDKYLRESMKGEITLTGDPEMIRQEILKQSGRWVKDMDEVPEEEFEKLPQFVSSEPFVRIVYTESERLEEGQVIPFSEANQLFDRLDKETRQKYGEEPYYDKTGFEIEYMKYGRIHTYSGRYDLGDSDGTLADHILGNATYSRTDQEWQELLARQGEAHQKEVNDEYDYIIEELVPDLNLHEMLSKMEREALRELEVLGENGLPEGSVFEYKDYYMARKEYAHISRMALNCEEYWESHKFPELSDYITESERKLMEAERKQAEKEIAQEAKAAGMTVEEYTANGYEPYAASSGQQEKKHAEHLSPYLQALIVGSAQAENGIYTMNADELPYASFLLLKEECEREGITDHIIFGKKGDVVCQDLSDIYKIPDVSAQKSYEAPEIKKRTAPSM